MSRSGDGDEVGVGEARARVWVVLEGGFGRCSW